MLLGMSMTCVMRGDDTAWALPHLGGDSMAMRVKGTPRAEGR